MPIELSYNFVMNIRELMAFTVKSGGSDLHLSTGLQPMIRIDGDMRHIKAPVIDATTMLEMIHSVMTENQKKNLPKS